MWVSPVNGQPNTTTILSSPSVTLHMDVCFSFWFNMAVTSLTKPYFLIIVCFQYSQGISSLRIVVEYDLDQEQVKLADTLMYASHHVTH